MHGWRLLLSIALGVLALSDRPARANGETAAAPAVQQAGSIRGVIYDRDFEAPLMGAVVTIVETSQKVTSNEQGNFAFSEVAPGKYTLVVAREGYVRQVKNDVVVSAGRLTDVDVWLAGDFTDMEEFVVQDILRVGAGSEAALLQLRFDSPAMMDSIGADLMSQAGASDAASALRLVSGASVQDGKSAVIRGLPDRYVSTQMNGVTLPSADEDKRAVELDQFPSAVIESIQVTKTFTPDQQGNASGGAVNVQLKGVPDEASLDFKAQVGTNSQVYGSDFLTYEGGGVDTWGQSDGSRDPQLDKLGESWDGAAGTTTTDAPLDSKFSVSGGGKHEFDSGWRVGGFASVFYERDSSYFDDGVSDSWWVDTPGQGMTPQYSQGAPSQGNFYTSLFDVTQASESVQWGGLGTFGVENDNHAIGLSYLYSHTAEDTATLAVDTRGKEYFFPGYDPNDPSHPGNDPSTGILAAPWLRFETLEYTERTTGTLQLSGEHRLPLGGFGSKGALEFGDPLLDWTLAESFADLDQPDKRQFGAFWVPDAGNGPVWGPAKPGENINLGNFQRIWKTIEEESQQGFVDLTMPFTQWSESEGFLKLGVYSDQLGREFDQDTFSNAGDNTGSPGGWDEPWSAIFPEQDHPIVESLYDVDYSGEQDVSAWYSMLDLPLTSDFRVIGGARFESTDISVVNTPEEFAFWFPPGSTSQVGLNPGDADVDFHQDDVLPSLGLVYEATEQVTLRASYSQTIARQTFKELTPIVQQEFLGGPIFIGNPDLQMSSLTNYDLRVDYEPYAGALLSASWFYKDITDPIEYVQKPVPFTYTSAVNYPEGQLNGYELELRQDLGRLFSAVKGLQGLSVGANGTVIDSSVQLPEDEILAFNDPGIQAPTTERAMTNAPEYLLNLYLTYDIEATGTLLGLFYTVQGDTLVAGAGVADGNYVPDVYASSFDSLNFTATQKLGKHFRLQFQAKNLTNPAIQTVYTSPYIGDEIVQTSYTAGIDLSLALGAKFSL